MSRTPTRENRTPQRTPQRTPNRTAPRTPTRVTTPRHLSCHSRVAFKAPVRTPDFASLVRKEASTHNSFFAYNPEKEPIRAYLRIRPQSTHSEIGSSDPYLHVVDDLEVSMTPPEDSNAYRTRNRAPERYKFSKIFTDTVSQQAFFNKTTLPLIHDVLKGQNVLIFAYGVTNSGKTFSIMGTKNNPGILPRTLDVIFNSIDDYMSESKVKPCMHSQAQLYTDKEEENRDVLSQITGIPLHSGSSQNPDLWDSFQLPTNRDTTAIGIDENFEYGIWVSFAEIYTEKIYDLLVKPDRFSKRKALSLKYEYSSGHKYISGLTEVRVKTIQEAYAILFEGQKNRAEYSTITNHTSSRSHSIFTIKIVRIPIDENNYIIEDPIYATVSKFSIVDLAGSERYRNTFNSGQRLKEAGNINKSLMVLGQCMETLRLNQLKTAIGKKTAMVPYRHSKLTELFKSSFEGDGKAVMVVNVNPVDTGFDENSHVMKFAAVAKDVATWRRVHPKLELKDISTFVNKRLRANTKDTRIYHGIDDLMKEDEDEERDDGSRDDDDDDDDNEDPFVDNLISQIDDLRNKWMESETSKAIMESEVRLKVTEDFEADLKKMEDIYMTSLKNWNDVAEAQVTEQTSTMNEGEPNNEKQNILSSTIDNMRTRLNDHEATKHSLLEKIAELEKEKQKQLENIKQVNYVLKERDATIEILKANNEPAVLSKPNEMELDSPFLAKPTKRQEKKEKDTYTKTETFENFLDLRKKLRRSIFRVDEYSHDADVIMTEIEQFEDVSFDLVKETNMGKLMKLITQRVFKNDPYQIQHRSKVLFKKYAKLSIPVLAPTKNKNGRGSMIVLSIPSGGEEDLICEMRTAMSTLQEENSKLKQRVKHMHEGHRRLQEAFEKTKVVEQDNMEMPIIPSAQVSDIEGENDVEMEEVFSPILGTRPVQPQPTKADEIEEDHSTLVDYEQTEGEQLYPPQPPRIKQRRKLRE
ncbi:kinesin motor domain-containing protein [Helicostylum pulchrum]|nr:kinesin motor domain-containing protein [Helicostylum pulchrum]